MSLIIGPEPSRDLVGRIISINPQVCTKFQCGGFWVNVSRPYSVVEPSAQQDQIHRALLDGRLMDITDQNIKGIETINGGHTATKEMGEVGQKIFIQRDKLGNVLVVVPKDDEEERKLDEEIQEKGAIHVDTYKVAPRGLIGEGLIDPRGAGEIMENMANKLDASREKYYTPRFK